MELHEKKCVPCEGGTLPLSKDEAEALMSRLKSGWDAGGYKKISKTFEFKNFVEAMSFVDRIADLAESEGHHPDIHIFYNKVNLDLSTHAIGGLSENDFILASKIDKLRT